MLRMMDGKWQKADLLQLSFAFLNRRNHKEFESQKRCTGFCCWRIKITEVCPRKKIKKTRCERANNKENQSRSRKMKEEEDNRSETIHNRYTDEWWACTKACLKKRERGAELVRWRQVCNDPIPHWWKHRFTYKFRCCDVERRKSDYKRTGKKTRCLKIRNIIGLIMTHESSRDGIIQAVIYSRRPRCRRTRLLQNTRCLYRQWQRKHRNKLLSVWAASKLNANWFEKSCYRAAATMVVCGAGWWR